eukprot:scaffold6393_cov135-Isochrysis_galbana.AAC.1
MAVVGEKLAGADGGCASQRLEWGLSGEAPLAITPAGMGRGSPRTCRAPARRRTCGIRASSQTGKPRGRLGFRHWGPHSVWCRGPHQPPEELTTAPPHHNTTPRRCGRSGHSACGELGGGGEDGGGGGRGGGRDEGADGEGGGGEGG